MEFDAIRDIIAKIMGMDPNEIEMDMSFQSDLGADSLDLYQILMGVEDELDITIPAEKLSDIKTVGDAVELIQRFI